MSRMFQPGRSIETNDKRAYLLARIAVSVVRLVRKPIANFAVLWPMDVIHAANVIASACLEKAPVTLEHIQRLLFPLFTEQLRDVRGDTKFACAFEAILLLLCLTRRGGSYCPVASISPLNSHLAWLVRGVVLREASLESLESGSIGVVLQQKFSRFLRQEGPFVFNYLRSFSMFVTKSVKTTPPEPDVSYNEAQDTITIYRSVGNQVVPLNCIEGRGQAIVETCEALLARCFLGYDMSDEIAIIDRYLDVNDLDFQIEDVIRNQQAGYSMLTSTALQPYSMSFFDKMASDPNCDLIIHCEGDTEVIDACRLSQFYVLAGEFVEVGVLFLIYPTSFIHSFVLFILLCY